MFQLNSVCYRFGSAECCRGSTAILSNSPFFGGENHHSILRLTMFFNLALPFFLHVAAINTPSATEIILTRINSFVFFLPHFVLLFYHLRSWTIPFFRMRLKRLLCHQKQPLPVSSSWVFYWPYAGHWTANVCKKPYHLAGLFLKFKKA